MHRQGKVREEDIEETEHCGTPLRMGMEGAALQEILNPNEGGSLDAHSSQLVKDAIMRCKVESPLLIYEEGHHDLALTVIVIDVVLPIG